MDSWLTNEIKEKFFKPCLETSSSIGSRLNDRLRRRQPIREEALTADLIDYMDINSNTNAWGTTIKDLQEDNIYVNTEVGAAKKESVYGADIGFVINRNIYTDSYRTSTTYSCLVQCKKVDQNGKIKDFFRSVNGREQSTMMLDITPSSFYFIYVPTVFLKTYISIEPIAYLQSTDNCCSPIWNMGHKGFDSPSYPAMPTTLMQQTTGILVVPALAVEAHNNGTSTLIDLKTLLPNCIPFWYWFGVLLLPGYIGDRKKSTMGIAYGGIYGNESHENIPFHVNHTYKLSINKKQHSDF